MPDMVCLMYRHAIHVCVCVLVMCTSVDWITNPKCVLILVTATSHVCQVMKSSVSCFLTLCANYNRWSRCRAHSTHWKKRKEERISSAEPLFWSVGWLVSCRHNGLGHIYLPFDFLHILSFNLLTAWQPEKKAIYTSKYPYTKDVH